MWKCKCGTTNEDSTTECAKCGELMVAKGMNKKPSESKKPAKRIFVDQKKSGAQPIKAFGNVALGLSIILGFGALYYALEIDAYAGTIALVTLLVVGLTIYFLCSGLSTLVASSAIAREYFIEKAKLEGIEIYDDK
ncbi:MAG: hypothetical protein RBT74_10615 [Tenuifilaceae bacterium]|jgi:hypothetical protein|nr:hypothetical protein [Tenuifilaceae bacterium]